MSKIHCDCMTGQVVDPDGSPRVMLYIHPDDPIPLAYTQYRVTFDPDAPARDRSKPYVRKNSNEAAILCRDINFGRWISGITDLPSTEAGAIAFICRLCEINSRAELDDNAGAALTFVHGIYEPFQRWLVKHNEQQHA